MTNIESALEALATHPDLADWLDIYAEPLARSQAELRDLARRWEAADSVEAMKQVRHDFRIGWVIDMEFDAGWLNLSRLIAHDMLEAIRERHADELSIRFHQFYGCSPEEFHEGSPRPC